MIGVGGPELIILIVPLISVIIVYKVFGKAIEAVYKWLLLISSYLFFVAGFAIALLFMMLSRNQSPAFLLFGFVLGFFMSIIPIISAKIIGRVQSLEARIKILEK